MKVRLSFVRIRLKRKSFPESQTPFYKYQDPESRELKSFRMYAGIDMKAVFQTDEIIVYLVGSKGEKLRK